jgi:TRAP-type transport system periplasmic protein
MLPELGDTVVEMTKGVRKAFDGNTLIAREFADNKIVPLMVNMFPPYQMISRGRPFTDLDSLRGKKITSGGGSLIVTLNALGANPIEMPAGDIYLSMQQGAIDGAMLALASVKPYKLEEVSKSMSSNGAFGSANGTWSIDSGVWAKLSPEHQKAMRDCGLKVEMQLAEWVDKWADTLKAEFKAKGVDVYEFSPASKKAISEKLALSRKDYVERLNKRGLPAQQALDEYMKILGR